MYYTYIMKSIQDNRFTQVLGVISSKDLSIIKKDV